MWCSTRLYFRTITIYHIYIYIYINDIVHSSSIATFIMFSDDTNLFFKHKNLEILYNIINCELAKISHWFKLKNYH